MMKMYSYSGLLAAALFLVAGTKGTQSESDDQSHLPAYKYKLQHVEKCKLPLRWTWKGDYSEKGHWKDNTEKRLSDYQTAMSCTGCRTMFYSRDRLLKHLGSDQKCPGRPTTHNNKRKMVKKRLGWLASKKGADLERLGPRGRKQLKDKRLKKLESSDDLSGDGFEKLGPTEQAYKLRNRGSDESIDDVNETMARMDREIRYMAKKNVKAADRQIYRQARKSRKPMQKAIEKIRYQRPRSARSKRGGWEGCFGICKSCRKSATGTGHHTCRVCGGRIHGNKDCYVKRDFADEEGKILKDRPVCRPCDDDLKFKERDMQNAMAQMKNISENPNTHKRQKPDSHQIRRVRSASADGPRRKSKSNRPRSASAPGTMASKKTKGGLRPPRQLQMRPKNGVITMTCKTCGKKAKGKKSRTCRACGQRIHGNNRDCSTKKWLCGEFRYVCTPCANKYNWPTNPPRRRLLSRLRRSQTIRRRIMHRLNIR